MSTITMTVELPEEWVRCLDVLPGGAKAALNELVAHAVEGVGHPATWERGWLAQLFEERGWIGKLERDPSIPGRVRPRPEALSEVALGPSGEADWPTDEATVPMRSRTPTP